MPGERRLTCHVLDASQGLPAAGVGVRLSRLDDGSGVLVETATDVDGRSDGPLLADGDLISGRYELEFDVGAYFTGRTGLGSPPYLDVVPVRFGVSDDVGHLHVALLVTPWSYTTYRGS